MNVLSPLISTQQLSEILSSPNLRLLDCRFDLAKPNWGRENYLLSHIPGAVYADLNRDLSSTPSPSTGRHPLPEPQAFVNTLARWAITPDTRVVVYDASGGGFAGRLWWMLRAVGHSSVQLLDGGLTQWQRDNLPLTAEVADLQPTSFHYKPEFNADLFVTSQEVFSRLRDPIIHLIDARAPERFQGLSETIDPVAGHIPGAINRFYGENLTPEGTFKPAHQLKQEFIHLLGGTAFQEAVVYCGSGVTSCHHLIALELAGLPTAKLYLGSWSEWIRDPGRPVAIGK